MYQAAVYACRMAESKRATCLRTVFAAHHGARRVWIRDRARARVATITRSDRTASLAARAA